MKKATLKASESDLLKQGVHPEFGYKQGDEVKVLSQGDLHVTVVKEGKREIMINPEDIKIKKDGKEQHNRAKTR